MNSYQVLSTVHFIRWFYNGGYHFVLICAEK